MLLSISLMGLFRRFLLWLKSCCKRSVLVERDHYGWADEIQYLLENYNNAYVVFYHLSDNTDVRDINAEFWKILFLKTSFQDFHFNYEEISVPYLKGEIDFNQKTIEHFFENHLRLDEEYISKNLPKIINMLEVNESPAQKFETNGMMIAINDNEYQFMNVDRIAVMLSVALNHAEKKDLSLRDVVNTAPTTFTAENKRLIFDLKLRIVGQKFGFDIGEKHVNKLNELLFSLNKDKNDKNK